MIRLPGILAVLTLAACGPDMQPNPSPSDFHQVGAPSPLFRKPDSSSAQIAVLIAGQNLRVLEFSDDWVRVQTQSGPKVQTGYMRRGDVNF